MKRIFLTLCVLGLFVFTRVFGIQDGLFFLNDMGRDFLVLWDWLQTGIPPLLGPQNSVLPFNQSALYFYWLMPIYLLSGQSAYASVITLVLTSASFFLVGIWKLRHHPWWPSILLTVAWLVTLHPTSIAQNRFVWNPSFLTPFLVLLIVSLWQYRETRKLIWLALVGIATGISLAFSYSLVPVFIALAIGILFLEKLQSWKIFLSMALGTLLTHLPTLAFEIRHRFILTQAVWRWLQNGATPDGTSTHFTPAEKIYDIFLHTLGAAHPLWHWGIGLLFAGICLRVLWDTWHTRKTLSAQRSLFLFTLSTLSLTVLITLILPIGVHAHYIFGIATLFFLCIATLPWWGRAPLLLVLTFLWILPDTFLPHFAPAPRTVSDMTTCAQLVCTQETQPLFISLESGILPFHNGPDWRYMFTAHNCQVESLEATPESASTMLVVVEESEYIHDETAFHELTLFGPSAEERIYECPNSIQVHVLEKE